MRRTALVGRFGVDSRVREDEDTQVAVRPRALRFFDPESGRRIGAGPVPAALDSVGPEAK
jgi:hypothetical protein